MNTKTTLSFLIRFIANSLSIAVPCIVLASIVHCSTETSAPTPTVLVSFNSLGGSAVESQTVVVNALATEPTDPTREGFEFAGWYTDEATTVGYNFSNPVTEALTLYAGWVATGTPSFTITFNTGDGGSAVAPEDVFEGATVPKPTDPTREGFEFTGWFTDEATIEEYIFTTPVTGALTLYAGWVVAGTPSFTITFNTGDGGSAIEPAEVFEGAVVLRPKTPDSLNYAFTGWFTDEATTELYDFTTLVTGAFTLYAGWKIAIYRVTFETNGGNPIDAIPIESGSGRVVASPGEPTFDPNTGIVSFVGWFASNDLSDNTEYTFGQTVTKDTTIYARWTYQVAYDPEAKAITGLDPEFIQGKQEGTIDLIIPSHFNGAEIDSIGQAAFKRDTFTRTITINNDGLKRIGDSAFFLARNWVEWPTLPNTLKSIGSYSMYLAAQICNIPPTSSPLVIPDSVDRIDSIAFLYIRSMRFERARPPRLAGFIDFENIKSYRFGTTSDPLRVFIENPVSRLKNCDILVPSADAARQYVDAIPTIKRAIGEGNPQTPTRVTSPSGFRVGTVFTVKTLP